MAEPLSCTMIDCVHVQHLGLPFNSEICFNDSSMTCIFLPRLLFSFCHDTVHRKAEEEEPGKEATFMHMHGELTLLLLFTLKVYFIVLAVLSVQQTVEKSLFLNYFYKHCMHRVMAPLMAQTAGERVSNGKNTGKVEGQYW